MPFKDPEKKREYHRKYMARQRLKAKWETREYYGLNRICNVSLEDLEANLGLMWEGKNSSPFEWKYYALKEAAGLLKIHTNTLRKWIKEGKVSCFQEAHHSTIFIPQSEINRLNDNSGFNKVG